MENLRKFQCEHTYLSDATTVIDVTDIERCRRQLFQKALIGRDPNRYGGYAFGNVSQRRGQKILITASQTSGIPEMDDLGYVFIERADLFGNKVWSTGAAKPSSETLTHIAVYEQDPNISAVIHVHSPVLWNMEKFPRTSPDANYGSQEMVQEVARLFKETDVIDMHVFAMGGHEDGIIAFGGNIEVVTTALLNEI